MASPKLEAQRQRVFRVAYAEAEKEHGKLLETCDEGTKCRNEIISDVKVKISEAWQKVIDELKISVQNSTKETRAVVKESW